VTGRAFNLSKISHQQSPQGSSLQELRGTWPKQSDLQNNTPEKQKPKVNSTV